LEVINLNEKANFPDQFSPQILRITPTYKTPFICMKPGQEIPPHPSGAGIFYIVSGRAVMTVEGEEVKVKSGDMIFVEKGESRGIRAVETLTAFAVHITD
jgi:mannose-6-phosphate isomerase-like protein (cupin superfamily)